MAKLLPPLYLGLAITGLVTTWLYNLDFFATTGSASIVAFFAAGFANSASASLTLDVVIAAVTGALFFLAEGRRLGMKHLWIYLLLDAVVAFSFALGLFLFMRARTLEAAQEPAPSSSSSSSSSKSSSKLSS